MLQNVVANNPMQLLLSIIECRLHYRLCSKCPHDYFPQRQPYTRVQKWVWFQQKWASRNFSCALCAIHFPPPSKIFCIKPCSPYLQYSREGWANLPQVASQLPTYLEQLIAPLLTSSLALFCCFTHKLCWQLVSYNNCYCRSHDIWPIE